MVRQTQPVVTDEQHDDTHPAFGMIHVSRVSNAPGAVLFDSDIRHGHTVVVTIETAARKRDLARDWIHSRKRVAEVEMSEGQWAAFVSSVGSQGVPCTLRATQENHQIPGLPYDPRLAHSMDEVKGAAHEAFGRIAAAVAAYDALDSKATAKQKREAINDIRNATRNVEANLEFVTKSLTEHAENVVQRSRADIEAMAMQAAERLGLPEGTRLLELDD
jgi:hypothetical protein